MEAPTTQTPRIPQTEAPTLPPAEAPTLQPTEAPTLPPTEAPTLPPPRSQRSRPLLPQALLLQLRAMSMPATASGTTSLVRWELTTKLQALTTWMWAMEQV
ncbi:hypothetical protein V7S43_003436 [Phytophthora oleae]|uniref:Uncharacterized protein n=1 Tax=Phytophthora oleae TaxID=2107226 RepID=A0ABD3G0D1_9STRA